MSQLVRLFVCVFLGASVMAGEVASDDPVMEVQRASDALAAARQSGDAEAFVALFTDDGVYMMPGLPDAAGRAAVRTLATKRFEGSKAEDIKILKRDVRVTEDMAYELAWFSEISRRDQAMRLQGRQFIVWKRGSDGAWRVQRYLYNFSAAEPLE